MFRKAIVREISTNYSKCIRDNTDVISMDKARQQHSQYVNLLKELSIDVISLPALEDNPDCCFVEDTVVIHKNNAYFPIMGATTRREENEQIKKTLKDYKNLIEGTIKSMEGGDVLHFEKKLISGWTKRTSLEGIAEASKKLEIKINYVKDQSVVHLKSYVSKLSENCVLVTEKYQNHDVFNKFEKLIVPEAELYAANVLEVNGNIIMPKNYPKTFELLKNEGFDVYTLETSEFKTCEGALTCLSILF